jgi:hypothetical protein
MNLTTKLGGSADTMAVAAILQSVNAFATGPAVCAFKFISMRLALEPYIVVMSSWTCVCMSNSDIFAPWAVSGYAYPNERVSRASFVVQKPPEALRNGRSGVSADTVWPFSSHTLPALPMSCGIQGRSGYAA